MHIAVILPAPFDGGVVRSAFNVVRMLALGARAAGESLELSFGYPEQSSTASWRLDDLEALGVNVRPFRLEAVPADTVLPYFEQFMKPRHRDSAAEYAAFNDGISNFEEADFWLIVSDHLPYLLPPHRHYAVIVYDYVFRYRPQILTSTQWDAFDLRSRMTRQADFVITTTEQARRDVVTYVGFPAERVHVFPIEFDPLGKLGASFDRGPSKVPRIIWPTIVSQHENHALILDGLEEFLAGHEFQVDVVGFHTQSFDPARSFNDLHPYVQEIRRRIGRSHLLRERMVFHGFVDDHDYQQMVTEAQLLLHSSRFDNGSYTVIEAAWLGTAAVSARYAAMEEVAQQFELPLVFFDATDRSDLPRQLAAACVHRAAIEQQLPARERLMSHTFADLAPAYWQQFRAAVGAVLNAEQA